MAILKNKQKCLCEEIEDQEVVSSNPRTNYQMVNLCNKIVLGFEKTEKNKEEAGDDSLKTKFWRT